MQPSSSLLSPGATRILFDECGAQLQIHINPVFTPCFELTSHVMLHELVHVVCMTSYYSSQLSSDSGGHGPDFNGFAQQVDRALRASQAKPPRLDGHVQDVHRIQRHTFRAANWEDDDMRALEILEQEGVQTELCSTDVFLDLHHLGIAPQKIANLFVQLKQAQWLRNGALTRIGIGHQTTSYKYIKYNILIKINGPWSPHTVTSHVRTLAWVSIFL